MNTIKRFWAIPSWNGDIRIEAPEGGDGSESSVLVNVNLTPLEREAVKRFEKVAIKAGWTELSGLPDRERVPLAASIANAGAKMASILGHKSAGVLTAFAFEGGKVKVTEVISEDGLSGWVSKMLKKEEAPVEAATTIRRPTLSCPECAGRPEKDRMPCDVLWAFLDEDQRESWLKHRAILAIGGTTQHVYRVACRDTDRAKAVGRCTVDLTNDVVLHHYNWTVPPEEEVLGIKLMLEHKENWLRIAGEVDPAHRATDVLESPFGPVWAMPNF